MRRKWFEYHCFESDQSADAALWHHSHQLVTVGECVNFADYGSLSRKERAEGGCPLVYVIQFADGFKGEAFEDELLTSRRMFERPDPPPETGRKPLS